MPLKPEVRKLQSLQIAEIRVKFDAESGGFSLELIKLDLARRNKCPRVHITSLCGKRAAQERRAQCGRLDQKVRGAQQELRLQASEISEPQELARCAASPHERFSNKQLVHIE
jgi:hypothetical protein